MNNFFFLILFSMLTLFSLILLYLNLMMSKKIPLNREKKSPFECGFDPLINPRLPFSIHFFLISLIFLIFDIELTLLIPSVILYLFFNKFLILSLTFFLWILLLGLYIEYSEYSIDWNL